MSGPCTVLRELIGGPMNMEDCPVHKAEANPPYPFTCSCPEEGYNDWNWKNLALAEYHGWAYPYHVLHNDCAKRFWYSSGA